MFIAALFIIAKNVNTLDVPKQKNGLKKNVAIYTMEYYSAIKKKSRNFQVNGWSQKKSIQLR